MRRLRALLLRLIDPFRRRSREQDLADELAAHLQHHIDDHVRRGLPPAEARRQAMLSLGGLEAAKQRYRERRGLPAMDALAQDVRQACRVARGHPGFTAVATLTLALGIGAAAIIYSVVRHIVIDPFPYAHSDRMVNLVLRDPATNRVLRGPIPGPEFLDYQERSAVFEDVLGTVVESVHFNGDHGAERLAVAWVTPNMVDFLGVAPLAGRAFGPRDGHPSSPCVALMNHRTWTSRFAADPAVIGRVLRLNHEPCTVIGVMPPRFEWNIGDLWVPSVLTRTATAGTRGARWFQARLRPGVTVGQAASHMDVVVRGRAAQVPGEYPEQFRVDVIKVIDWVVGRFRAMLYTMFAAVGVLLLIACCNVANMLLARASGRHREMVVRNALGASRGRIVRQLIVENLLLALGGGVAGCALAFAGIDALRAWMPRQNVPWEAALRLDGYVLGFAFATALVSTLVFGLVPALQATRRELTAGGGRTTATRQQNRLRGALVGAEVALSVVLLLGAGVLVRSFMSLTAVTFGVEPRTVMVAGIAFAPGTYTTAPARHQFYRTVLDRAERLPDIEAVAVTDAVLSFGGRGTVVSVPGRTVSLADTALIKLASEGYGRMLALRILAGRDLTRADIEATRAVAVVNQTFARRYFSGRSPVGQIVRFQALKHEAAPEPAFEIVGVAEDRLNAGRREATVPDAYVPMGFGALGSLRVAVRAADDGLAALEPLRRVMRGIDADVALVAPLRFDRVLSEEVYAQPRFVLLVFAMFAAAGLSLVTLGIYGVLSYTVALQTREIAIRVAMGGEHRHVMALVLRTGLRLVVIGVAIGLVVSLFTNRLLVTQLWNTSPHEPAIVALVVATIVAVGAVACLVPARRAMRIEPIVALRQE